MRGETSSIAYVNILANTASNSNEFSSIEQAPGPPLMPTVIASNETTATLNWDPPKDLSVGEISSYIIEYYSTGGSWIRSANTPLKPPYTLVGLDPKESYGAVIRAKTRQGISEPSGIVEIGGDGMKHWQSYRRMSQMDEIKVVLGEINATYSSPDPTTYTIKWKVC